MRVKGGMTSIFTCNLHTLIQKREQPKSRQNARLFSSRRNGTPPPSHLQANVPPLLGSGGELAGKRGGGRAPIPTRGHTLWDSKYM
jgi:hypothetical protein